MCSGGGRKPGSSFHEAETLTTTSVKLSCFTGLLWFWSSSLLQPDKPATLPEFVLELFLKCLGKGINS